MKKIKNIKKLISTIIFLTFTSLSSANQYKEAPMLKRLVKAGKLPSVDDIIKEDPEPKIEPESETKLEEDIKLAEEKENNQKMNYKHPLVSESNQNKTPTDKPFIRNKPKIGRNEPCPCGSGKKYKQCHGRLS